LKDRPHLDMMGSAAEMGLVGLLARAAGSHLAVAAALRQKYEEYVASLLADGPEPNFAERMAAVRAGHNWLAVHILECMAAKRQPYTAEALAIERRLTSAERRLHASFKSLAVLRRLRKAPIAKGTGSKSGTPVANDGPGKGGA
jgi:hypothetical protein